jgi:ubiquitin-activating enzyme E1 C
MKNPGITANISGKIKTLYIQSVSSIEEKTRQNLSRTLFDLGLRENSEIIVADITTPSTIIMRIKVLKNS